MKISFKLLLAAGAALVLAAACKRYDDTELRGKISSLESRFTELENLVKTANKNIQDLQTLTAGLDKAVFVTAVNELPGGGYEIKFSNNKTATIKDGKDGKDGEDGSTPVIGVKQDTDGIYYWTINGEWLLDAGGNKLRVTGEKGAAGDLGQDGITPQLKIEDGLWYVSVDKGETWTVLGNATGENGDSLFKDVTWDDNYVYVTLQNDTVLQLSRGANGVKALSVVPDLEDGGVMCLLNEFTVRFDVLPASAAETLAGMAPDLFKVNVVYTRTKTDAGEEVVLPVKSIAGSAGRLTLTVDGSGLCEEFAVGKLAAHASLSIDDGTHAATSGYFPVQYDTEKVRALVEKQWQYYMLDHEVERLIFLDIGYSFKDRFFEWIDDWDEDGVPSPQLFGKYMLYQLPDGAVKLFSDSTPAAFFIFKNITESSAEFLMHFPAAAYEYSPQYYILDEYGCYDKDETWTAITVRPSPKFLTWKQMALKIGDKYYPMWEGDRYWPPFFADAVLHGMEQSIPMVRMNNYGEEADFAKVDVKGKIAVVNKGGIRKYDKLLNAYKAGACALFCVLDQGAFLPKDDPMIDIPFVEISEEAARLLNGHTFATFAYCMDPNDMDGE